MNVAKEPAVTPEEYIGRVRATARRAAEYLPAAGLDEVQQFIDHGEPAEGLCSLAWLIVKQQVQVPSDVIDAIYEYTAGLVDDEFMPSNLRDFALYVG